MSTEGKVNVIVRPITPYTATVFWIYCRCVDWYCRPYASSAGIGNNLKWSPGREYNTVHYLSTYVG